MPDQNVTLLLESTDGTSTAASGQLKVFTVGNRIARSAGVFGICFGLALTLIPIPIIHLLGIPLMLLLGVVLAVKQFSSRGRLAPLKMACPRCGGTNRLGGGLGVRNLTGPFEHRCEDCRRTLNLRIVPR